MRARRRLGLTAAAGLLAVCAWLIARGGDDARRDSAPPSAEPQRSAPVPDAPPRARQGSRSPEAEARSSTRMPSGRQEASADVRRRDGPRRPGYDIESADLRLGGTEPILLDPLAIGADAATVAIAGHDPLAPRELVAWRLKGGRRAVLARGFSEPGGALRFPPVLAPGEGLKVVVTGADGAPGVPGASRAQQLGARLPTAPHASLLASTGTEYQVRIVPAEAVGQILLADPQGEVFAAYPVLETPDSAARLIDLALTLPAGDSHFLLAHEFDDGRRSDWRPIPLGEELEGAD